METLLNETVETLGALWSMALLCHLLSAEDSKERRLLLKIFARWIEVPILRFIWMVSLGPLHFIIATPLRKKIVGAIFARPFAKWVDTGVPVPAKEVVRLIQAIDGPIAVGDCRCRQARKTCDHPMLTDIVIRTGAEAWLWAFPDNYRIISKNEAIRIVEDCAKLGMFQMVFIHCSTASHANEYVVCNCCVCGCKIHLLNRTMGQKYFPLPDGGFRSLVDQQKCDRCGKCLPACPFQAITMTDHGIEIVDCFGCGLCEQACPQEAFTVSRVNPGPPWAQEAWRDLATESTVGR